MVDALQDSCWNDPVHKDLAKTIAQYFELLPNSCKDTAKALLQACKKAGAEDLSKLTTKKKAAPKKSTGASSSTSLDEATQAALDLFKC